MPFNFLFTSDVVKPQDFQPTGSGLRAPHFSFIQEGVLRTNTRWIKPTRNGKTAETAQGRQNSARSSPCAARHPPKQHRLRQPRILERYSLARSAEGIRDPHPSGLPAAPSPLCTAPKMPPGVKSLMASQVPSWPSFTSISLVSLRRTAAGRGREPGQRGAGGRRERDTAVTLIPPHSPGGCAILMCRKGRAAGAHGRREGRESGRWEGRGWRHVGCVTAPCWVCHSTLLGVSWRHVGCVTAPCWVCHGAMLGVSLPPQEGPWLSRCLLEPVQPVLGTGQAVINTNWEWEKFGLDIQK